MRKWKKEGKRCKYTKTVKTKQTEAIKQLEKLKFNKIKFEAKTGGAKRKEKKERKAVEAKLSITVK